MPGNDQEDLTPEERDEVHFKVLTSKNPQAPHNLTKFSWKDRCFKTDDFVDQLVFHYSAEGSILLKESDEAAFQEEYKDAKKKQDNMMLEKINKAIKEATGGKFPRKYATRPISVTLRHLINKFEFMVDRRQPGRVEEVTPQHVQLSGAHLADAPDRSA